MSVSGQASFAPIAARRRAREGGAVLRFLSLQDTMNLLDPADVVRIAEETMLAHESGGIMWSDPRIVALNGAPIKARFRVKLCAVTTIPAVGFRVTSSVPGAEKLEGGPSRMVLLSDANTGEFRCILDERWTFALRTGAGAAIAIKHLHGFETDTVGLIGAGHMAKGTLYALKAALPRLKAVYVNSRSAESRERLAAEMSPELGISVVPLDSAEAVLATAGATVVSTSAKSPFISEAWIKPGATVYTMGAHQELDTPSYLKADKFIADDWGQVQLKADMVDLMGQGVFGPENVYANLPEILAGTKPGRESPTERIVVRSEGLVTMDVALAHHLYTLALERGIGQTLDV
jgi:ornithine cyclodeaminase/alanine dehydrogenase-like protein (mu-crystallin family)